jgi:hypothetical protein
LPRFPKTLLLLPLPLLSLPLSAGQTTATAYQCSVNASAGTHDCGSPITVSGSGSQRTAEIDLSGGYVRLDALVDICSPSGYWMHFGDSPSDNGGGGDAGQTYHDAETYFQGTTFYMYGMYDYARGVLDPAVARTNAVSGSGCRRVQFAIREDQVAFDPNGDTADAFDQVVNSVYGFDVAPYNEVDNEDPSGVYANKWYAGINRTVGDSSRSGSGVSKACFVLSKTTSPDPSTISSLCPAPPPPANVSPYSCFSAYDTGFGWANFNAYCSYDPDGSIIDYFWTFGDGYVGYGSFTSHYYMWPGFYSVSLTVTDNQGATGYSVGSVWIYCDGSTCSEVQELPPVQ